MTRDVAAIEEIEGAEAGGAIEAVNGLDTPLVFRGLCSHWPLVEDSHDPDRVERRLRAHYEGAPVTVYIGEPGDRGRIFYSDDLSRLNFRPARTDLDDVLRRIRRAAGQAGSGAVYMGSTPLSRCLPGMLEDHSLAPHDPATSVRIWIGNATTVAAHYDVMDNIACVCAGTRSFTLFPPDQHANLYLGPIDLTPAGQQVSVVDPENPDLERFPRYAEALDHAQAATLEPGDAIYIPSMWWHQVTARASFNVLINHWWRHVPAYMGAPGDVLMHALLELRGLPRRERRAWRALFDHYVFDPPGDALDHIPEENRGVLGELNENRARHLRAVLRNKLNR